MISYLKGVIVEKSPTRIVMEVGNTGYEIEIPLSTYESIADPGNEAKVYTRLYIRDDAVQIYGFSRPEERLLFDLVTSVSGIGPQSARTILSHTSVERFVNAVLSRDEKSRVAVPGIGRKSAQRLILELHDAMHKHFPGGIGVAEGAASGRMMAEAYSALVQLGYNPAEARKLLEEVSQSAEDIASAEELIRASLKRAR